MLTLRLDEEWVATPVEGRELRWLLPDELLIGLVGGRLMQVVTTGPLARDVAAAYSYLLGSLEGDLPAALRARLERIAQAAAGPTSERSIQTITQLCAHCFEGDQPMSHDVRVASPLDKAVWPDCTHTYVCPTLGRRVPLELQPADLPRELVAISGEELKSTMDLEQDDLSIDDAAELLSSKVGDAIDLMGGSDEESDQFEVVVRRRS